MRELIYSSLLFTYLPRYYPAFQKRGKRQTANAVVYGDYETNHVESLSPLTLMYSHVQRSSLEYKLDKKTVMRNLLPSYMRSKAQSRLSGREEIVAIIILQTIESNCVITTICLYSLANAVHTPSLIDLNSIYAKQKF